MILEVKELGFHFHGGAPIFQNVSFSLDRGEVLSILGTNGAGKTTLLNCIAALYRPTAGEIFLDGKPLSALTMREVARQVGYVPQIRGIPFAYSVREFTVMGRTPYIGAFQKPSKEDYAVAEANLERLGIAGLKNKLFTELSGGEQQCVCLARALTQQSELILLDEPTNHLDYGNQYRTMDTIRRLAAEEGCTILMTTHNPDHALLLGGKAAILGRDGALAVGSAAELMNTRTLSELYGLDIEVSYNDNAGRNVCVVCGGSAGKCMKNRKGDRT